MIIFKKFPEKFTNQFDLWCSNMGHYTRILTKKVSHFRNKGAFAANGHLDSEQRTNWKRKQSKGLAEHWHIEQARWYGNRRSRVIVNQEIEKN